MAWKLLIWIREQVLRISKTPTWNRLLAPLQRQRGLHLINRTCRDRRSFGVLGTRISDRLPFAWTKVRSNSTRDHGGSARANSCCALRAWKRHGAEVLTGFVEKTMTKRGAILKSKRALMVALSDVRGNWRVAASEVLSDQISRRLRHLPGVITLNR